jgi:hypothetical protein
MLKLIYEGYTIAAGSAADRWLGPT